MSDASGEECAPTHDIEEMLASDGFHHATEWEQKFLEEMEDVPQPTPAQENKLCEIQQQFWCMYEPMQTLLDKDD